MPNTKKSPHLNLGLDIGSVNLHAALLGQDSRVIKTLSIPIKGRQEEALQNVLTLLSADIKNHEFSVSVTGMGRDILKPIPTISLENEITSCALAAHALVPKAQGILEVGGHFSKWISLDEHGQIRDYSLNELCAAGSGAFLEQQANRLNLSIEEMAEAAVKAPKGAPVAGRCSVFAKSDMIHLQQKGTPLDEIAFGLCLALARNYAATVLKGREMAFPLIMIGGCAANKALIRAFQDVLQIKTEDLIIPERHSMFPAIGSALAGKSSARGTLCLAGFQKEISRVFKSHQGSTLSIPPLPRVKHESPAEEKFAPISPDMEVFIGVDVGSVSTDFAILDKDLNVIEGVYLPTRGQPIAVMEEGLAIIQERTLGKLKVLGVGTTGSGRHLALEFLQADTAKNEITAQLKSAVHYFPQVDTILEIGGQDSKYICAKNGAISDFAMNKICAAGTGSFLEEQANRLGLSIIKEFEEKALKGDSPADLGSRCTVFMDTELVHALQRGTSIENVSAGLAYAIASNYLEKVVGPRPVGHNIVFQGGVASNKAVVAAFSGLLNKEVCVHPYNRLSGAIGAALIAAQQYAHKPFKTRFIGFKSDKDYKLASFECKHCSNVCQVIRMQRKESLAYFGDVCERHTSTVHGKKEIKPTLDLSREREHILSHCLPAEFPIEQEQTPFEKLWAKSVYPHAPTNESGAAVKSRGTIGIPRASLYFELFPIWAGMFKSLGYEIVLSEPSSKELLAQGMRAMSSETCLPVKLAYSHALDLAKKKVDYIFLPSVKDLPAPFGSPELCSTCPYTQSLPFMIKPTVQARFLVPQINMSMEADGIPDGLEVLAQDLGIDRRRLRAAYQTGKDAYLEFKQSLLKKGDEILSSPFSWAVVLIGKPYNIYDSYLNLNLAKHLARMGVLAIPYEFISRLGSEKLDESWDSLSWRFNRDYIKAASVVCADKRLVPIVVSNFGCGPDAFTVKYLEKLFADKPALFLEFDEHRGEAGLVTRLEAFIDEVSSHLDKKSVPRPPKPLRQKNLPGPGKRKFFLPHFADHAHAYCGALRYAGYEAHVLPAPSEATRRKGERYSSGKECHPYSILAGDLINLSEKLSGLNIPATFIFPGTSIPCLLTQYGPGHKLILDQIGEEHIDVMTPDSRDIYELLGIQGGVRLWQGLTAVDMLVKVSCELRPYELHKGSVDQAHRENCLALEKAIESGDILQTVKNCVERLSSSPIDTKAWENKERPVVGVAGDIFTRSNQFANQELFAKLEAMGCEVWPSPFIVDIFDFGLKNEFFKNLQRRNISGLFQKGWVLLLKEISEKGVRKLFQQHFRAADEPGYKEVLSIAAPYVGTRSSEVLMLNAAKMVDFAVRGADGIVNAMCFNCMVGSVSSAITSKLRSNHNNIPVVNLVFGGTEGTSQTLRLEAFVHQVKNHAAAKKKSPAPVC